MGKKSTVINMYKLLRKIRRQVEIEKQTPKVYSHIFKTTKKDQQGRIKNTINVKEYENEY